MWNKEFWLDHSAHKNLFSHKNGDICPIITSILLRPVRQSEAIFFGMKYHENRLFWASDSSYFYFIFICPPHRGLSFLQFPFLLMKSKKLKKIVSRAGVF